MFIKLYIRDKLSILEMGMGAKKMLNEGKVVPAALYGTETCGLREAKRRKLNVIEMGC